MRKTELGPLPSDLQLDVLLALVAGPLGSSALLQTVEDLRDRDVPLATFYRQLQRTADLGWIVADVADPAARPGRPERSYRLSTSGTRVLRSGIEAQRRRVAHAEAAGLSVERLLTEPRS
ncbi:MAG: hypothetical protein MPN21_13600 [Thermoanaerobaculia bacterium]|nr:hypothetical protein [Thermoanaerobaculia bacterium]